MIKHQGGVVKTKALLTRAGQGIPASRIIAPAEADRQFGFLAFVAHDLQVLQQRAKSLQASEQFYRQIVRKAHVGIWVIDPENQTSFVNPQMASMLGYCENEMVGKPATFFARWTQTAFSKFSLDNAHELLLRRRDGEDIWVSLSPCALYNEQEQFVGTCALVTEVAESKKWRERIELI